MKPKAEKQAEQQAACDSLRNLFPVGSTCYTVLRHVSRSGMQRSISVLTASEGQVIDVTGLACRALEMSFDRNNGGLKIGGYGTDMGFEIVYNLGRVLYPDGQPCIGPDCLSNDHMNGDRDYSQHMHRDSGYALRQRWI